jgi:undecaprenyl pyrophosphate phosphatase UppP
MEVSVDNITSIIKKTYQSISALDTSSLLGLILAVGFVTLVVGLIRESILNANTIIMSLFIGTIVYIYMKREYEKKLKSLRIKNRELKTDSILDDLCMGEEVRDKNTCNQYKQAKTNFYQLSNTLIQKYNWKK